MLDIPLSLRFFCRSCYVIELNYFILPTHWIWEQLTLVFDSAVGFLGSFFFYFPNVGVLLRFLRMIRIEDMQKKQLESYTFYCQYFLYLLIISSSTGSTWFFAWRILSWLRTTNLIIAEYLSGLLWYSLLNFFIITHLLGPINASSQFRFSTQTCISSEKYKI